ncbi:helix-turn-helix protein [Clostridium puniceum]|uniref:Helix-turn-helix protein n=1 Tax=Clostridium puniceum TaxID=29367 RepID=A0A1S8TCF7_9CLOT|nr:helix-turn-helix transcriptional regulator [Clostridium puniceum]OOM75115.1 helix-turn-helix protein [Clostridium puniceum]
MSKIREIRIKSQLDTESACNKLGISKSMLYKIETGYRQPSKTLILKMSQLYQCTIEEIYKILGLVN